MSEALLCYPSSGAEVCVPAEVVRAVVRAPALSPVPGAPPWLRGAWNHLGTAVVVLDALAAVGLRPPCAQVGAVLLVSTPYGLLGLAADDTPIEIRARRRNRHVAVFDVLDKGSDRLELDLERLCSTVEAILLASYGGA